MGLVQKHSYYVQYISTKPFTVYTVILETRLSDQGPAAGRFCYQWAFVCVRSCKLVINIQAPLIGLTPSFPTLSPLLASSLVQSTLYPEPWLN